MCWLQAPPNDKTGGAVRPISPGAPSHVGVCSLQAPCARVATAQREVRCSYQSQALPAHD